VGKEDLSPENRRLFPQNGYNKPMYNNNGENIGQNE
jgi:hypothetical protein